MAKSKSAKNGTDTVEMTPPADPKQETQTAPTVPTEAPKEESAEEQAARQAAFDGAEKRATESAKEIATEWAKVDRGAKDANIKLGKLCWEYTSMVQQEGILAYDDAMSLLYRRLQFTTGDSKRADIPRIIGVYFASNVFGSRFADVGIRGQKEIATLLTRIKGEDKCDVYVLRPDWGKDALTLFGIIVGEIIPPAHLKEYVSENRPEGKGKPRPLYGEAIADLVGRLKASYEEHPTVQNPLSTLEGMDKEGKEAAKKAREEAKKAKGKDKGTSANPEGKEDPEDKEDQEEGNEQGATGKRNGASGLTLDVKPAIAAVEVVNALTEHPEKIVLLGDVAMLRDEKQQPLFDQDCLLALIRGLSAAGRKDDLEYIMSQASYELRVIKALNENKNLTRQQVVATLSREPAKKAG